MLQNTRQVVCIELLAATRGVRARLASGEVALGAGTGAAYALLEPLIGGETPADDIAAVEQRVSSGALLAAVQGVVGGLEGVARGR